MPPDSPNQTPPPLPSASGNFVRKYRKVFIAGAILLLLCVCVLSAFIAIKVKKSTEERMAAQRQMAEINEQKLMVKEEFFRKSVWELANQEANFRIALFALDPTLKGCLENPARLLTPACDARNQIAKVKTAYEQWRAAKTALLAKMNEELSQQDPASGSSVTGSAKDFRRWLVETKEIFEKSSSNKQPMYERFGKIYPCLDQALADLQANPDKWKWESDGRLTFLDEALQAKVMGKIDECRAAMKQRNTQPK